MNPQAPNSSMSSNDTPPARRQWLWPVIIIAGVVLVAIITFIIFSLTNKQQPQTVNERLRIGQQAYLFACSIANRDDFERVFELDGSQAAGELRYTGVVPGLGSVKNLIDVLPQVDKTDPSFVSDCQMNGYRTDKTLVTLRTTLTQFASTEQANRSFTESKTFAAGGGFGEEPDFSTLVPLPSFEQNSYIEVPPAGDTSAKTIKAVFWQDSRKFELAQAVPEVSDAALARLAEYFDEYAKAMIKQVQSDAATRLVDNSGVQTTVGRPLADVCARLSLNKVATIVGDVQYRADEATCQQFFGAITGSAATNQGAYSSLQVAYNTASERAAQQSIQTLTRQDQYPHGLEATIHRFANEAEATTFATTQKTMLSQPTDGVTPVVSDQPDLGQQAFTLHQETPETMTRNGQAVESATIDDRYVVRAGSDVIIIAFTQLATSQPYETAPIEVTNDIIRQLLEELKAIS